MRQLFEVVVGTPAVADYHLECCAALLPGPRNVVGYVLCRFLTRPNAQPPPSPMATCVTESVVMVRRVHFGREQL